MSDLALAFAAAFLIIMVKTVQGRNFVFNNYAAVMPCSMVIAALELYVVAAVAKQGWSLSYVLAIGTGGGLGAMLGMYTHNRWIKKSES